MKTDFRKLKYVKGYNFYCDMCSKFIGTSIWLEGEDPSLQLGHVRINVELDGKKYKREVHLCEDCMEGFKNIMECDKYEEAD